MPDKLLDKRSLAWFKLTEFTSNGERERAIGIYKLLALSFDNPAFAEQLMGDLLLAFEDSEWEDKYLQAAQLYEQQQQPEIAVALYQHLINLRPANTAYWELLIKSCLELARYERLLQMMQQLKSAPMARSDINRILQTTIATLKEKDQTILAQKIQALGEIQ